MQRTKSAFKVFLDVDRGALIARIDSSACEEGAEYAFYLNHEGTRVEKRWYEKSPFFRFATAPGRGQYHAVAFIRSGDGSDARSSKSEILNLDDKPSLRQSLSRELILETTIEQLQGALPASGRARMDVAVRGQPFIYPCLFIRQPGERLFVMLGGATGDRSEVTLPKFNRFSWAPDFPGSVLCIADPTLMLNARMRLGWYFGDKAYDATAGLVEVVGRFAELLGFSPKEVVTYGSSGGGFAAMQVAARMGDGATAIAINPQTEVLDYAQKDIVNEFLSVCVGGAGREAALDEFGSRLSLSLAWRTAQSRKARCLVVQNLKDFHHLKRHLRPFAEKMGIPESGLSADGRMRVIYYDYPNGHGAEPRSMVPEILKAAFALSVPGEGGARDTDPALTERVRGINPCAKAKSRQSVPIVLHIGLPKTGTTYLQRTLMKAAADRKDDFPFSYPDTGFYNHQIALYVPIGSYLPWKAKAKSTRPWEALKLALETPGGRKFLLSAEALSALQVEGIEAFRNILADHPVERIIITSRPLGSLIPSHWQQNMKQGGRGELGAYAERILGAVRSGASPAQMFSAARAATLWREVFPAVPISVLGMNGQHEQNLFAFAQLCGFPASYNSVLLDSVPVASEQNLSFAVDECAELLKINREIAAGRLQVEARDEAMKRFFKARDKQSSYRKPALDAKHSASALSLDARGRAEIDSMQECEWTCGAAWRE